MRPTLVVLVVALRFNCDLTMKWIMKKTFFTIFVFWFYRRLESVEQFHRSADLASKPSSLSILKPKPIKIRLAEKKEVKRNEVDHLGSIQSRFSNGFGDDEMGAPRILPGPNTEFNIVPLSFISSNALIFLEVQLAVKIEQRSFLLMFRDAFIRRWKDL